MKKGFTLLEVVIVIIIIGVLTSLALPRLFSVVEGARAAEALATISSLRTALERCYLMNNGSYRPCEHNLDIEFPGFAPGDHFFYSVTSSFAGKSYIIRASRRQNIDGGEKYAGYVIAMGMEMNFFVTSNQKTTNIIQWFTDDGKIYWDAADIYKGFIPKGN